MRVVPEPENPTMNCPVNSGYGFEKLKKNGYEAGTLKMGMGMGMNLGTRPIPVLAPYPNCFCRSK